ncbi:hypothetical protein ACLKA7_011444 [Drosophila subpalustris]
MKSLLRKRTEISVNYILNYEFGSDYLTNKWKGASLAASFYYNTTHAILCDPEVQSMLKDKNEHFDMVVLDPTCSDSLNGFAERFDALQVGLSSFGSSWLVDYKAGNSAPSVYRPISPMGYSHGEGLVNKWNNWILIVEEWIMDQLIYLPIQLELFRRYFAFPPEKFYERRRNFSLMLINQHFSLGRVRSNSPNIIEVGGMHMAEPSPPLDPKLLDFLDGAEHGVIYFSMGMEILNNWLPNKVEENMLQAFSQLKQRVIWKHEMETMPNKSDNIYLTSMASQRLLLEHPNMKLFITHGGLLSLIEAAYAGVPMLGLPVYFDQFDNVERMQQAGVSITMDIATLTVEQLTHNIKELLENPRYALKAKELSSRFRDQPTSPLDRAVWWTEYVLRHKGAPHMRIAEHDMGFVPYYRIQFFSILYGRIIVNILNYEFGSDYLTNKWKGASLAASFYYNTTHAILCDPEVKSMLKDKNEHFDMVVLDPTCTDSLNGFAERFDALQVGLSSFGSSWLVDYKAGNSAPSVYRPISPMGYSHGEGLVNKWNNWILIVEEWIMDQLIYLPIQLELFRRYFAFPPEKFYERRRNFSLMLINQHFSLGRVRSNSPNIIEVGGMHMAEPSPPLDPKLLDFLDGAEHGVIYFSMGMEILNNWLPNKVEENMLQAFSQLKQRVIWKHEMETMPNKSDNIYLTSMASQRLLLEHPNMKLFITHGGLLSLIEAAYAGVPMLGLPVYFDQFDNVERMHQAGVALIMDVNTLTTEQLTHNIRELLENPRYALKAKELSSRFRDQPTSPLERAVWWTEYVLRHKGAPHMRIAEHEMGFVAYYRIHFFLILYGRVAFTALIVIIASFIVVKRILKKFRWGIAVFGRNSAINNRSRHLTEFLDLWTCGCSQLFPVAAVSNSGDISIYEFQLIFHLFLHLLSQSLART